MNCCIFLLCFAVWCDAGRNSRTSAVFQLNAARVDVKPKQTTSECSAHHKICMKDVVQSSLLEMQAGPLHTVFGLYENYTCSCY